MVTCTQITTYSSACRRKLSIKSAGMEGGFFQGVELFLGAERTLPGSTEER
jgi:hypothetical protein